MVCDVADSYRLNSRDLVTVSEADPALAVEWASQVRAAMVVLRRFQAALDAMEAAVTVTNRMCHYCGRPIPESAGKAIYCRRSCRQRAYEARRDPRT
jgi:hypothetical protein